VSPPIFPRTSAELVKNTSLVSPATLATVKDALDNLQGRAPSALPVPIAEGGTGQITAVAAFNALSPLTTLGDLLTNDGTNNIRLAVGAANTFLGSTGAAVPSWRTAAQVLTSLGIVTGTYTPTLTNVANLDASVANSNTMYLQIGNLVLVWGTCTADATAGGVTTQLDISLPVASDLTSGDQLAGAGWWRSAPDPMRVRGDATNDRAVCGWVAGVTTNNTLGFIFGYRVL
jgi:hypothetical protein